MPKLRLEEAPGADRPLRFLFTMPLWGVAGGLAFAAAGTEVLASRWHPLTLALVHVWTLGVLGNAMFGALLQFLPVAAGTAAIGPRSAPWLHALFNLGVLALVAGLGWQWWPALGVAGCALPASFLWLAALTLPALWRAGGERLLRAGIATAVGFGGLAALAGALLLGLLSAPPAWLPALVDVHAGFGVVGWMLVLLAAVGRVTMPMFQATRALPARVAGGWLGLAVGGLVLAGAAHLAWPRGPALAAFLAVAGAGFALGVLIPQWPVSKPRRHPLYRQWRWGAWLLLAAAGALVAGRGVVAGVLAIGLGLPLLVGAMALEIVPFVTWIALRRRIPRGTQVPGVARLLEDAPKQRVWRAQWLATLATLAALAWPRPVVVALAGLLLAAAWALAGWTLAGVWRAARRFERHVAASGRD